MRSSLDGKILSEREAAIEIGVNRETLGRWLNRGWVSNGKEGRLPGEMFHLGPPPMVKCGGSWVGLRSEIEAWADAYGARHGRRQDQ